MARRIKEGLSASDSVVESIELDGRSFNVEVTREQFDALIDPLVKEDRIYEAESIPSAVCALSPN